MENVIDIITPGNEVDIFRIITTPSYASSSIIRHSCVKVIKINTNKCFSGLLPNSFLPNLTDFTLSNITIAKPHEPSRVFSKKDADFIFTILLKNKLVNISSYAGYLKAMTQTTCKFFAFPMRKKPIRVVGLSFNKETMSLNVQIQYHYKIMLSRAIEKSNKQIKVLAGHLSSI